jgi:hypothetical protein
MSRRENERYQVWIPVKVDALREGLAITRDASTRGVLMLTASKLEPGTSIELSLKLPDDPVPKRVAGKVVRVEENAADPHGLWPHRMAVEFDEEIADLEWIVGATTVPERRKAPRADGEPRKEDG